MIQVAGGLTRNPADQCWTRGAGGHTACGELRQRDVPPTTRESTRSIRSACASPHIRLYSRFLVGTAQQTSHLLFEALKRCRLGVGAALRPRLSAGRGRLAHFAARGGRRRGLFQNSGLLELAGHLHAGIEQLDCASRRQYNPSDNVPPASRLGGRRFHLYPKPGAFKESRSLAARLARRCSYFASDFELETLPSMTPQPIHSHSSRRRW
jgi:hypothetical protein